MRELHCKEECELLMQHAAITSPVITGDDIVYSLFFLCDDAFTTNL